MPQERAQQIARDLGGTVTSGELIAAGVRWEDLYRLRDNGGLLELSRGVFRLAEAPPTAYPDFLAVCRRAPGAMVCLNSAAGYWDLTDELPASVHIAVPRGSHRPVIDYPSTTVHVFATATFALGRVEETIDSGEVISITSRERTVVDLMRLRSRVGRDQALAALRTYLQGRNARPGELLQLAQQLRAGTTMAAAMEPLMS